MWGSVCSWCLAELLTQTSVFTGFGVLQWILGLYAGCLPADETQDRQGDEWVPGAEKHSAVLG